MMRRDLPLSQGNTDGGRSCPERRAAEEGRAWWWGPIRQAFTSQLRPAYCLDPAGQKPHLGDLPDQGIVLEVQEGGALDMLCKAPSEAWRGVNVVSGLGCLLLMGMSIHTADEGPGPFLWRAAVPRSEPLSCWGLGQAFICSAQTPEPADHHSGRFCACTSETRAQHRDVHPAKAPKWREGMRRHVCTVVPHVRLRCEAPGAPGGSSPCLDCLRSHRLPQVEGRAPSQERTLGLREGGHRDGETRAHLVWSPPSSPFTCRFWSSGRSQPVHTKRASQPWEPWPVGLLIPGLHEPVCHTQGKAPHATKSAFLRGRGSLENRGSQETSVHIL